MPTSASGGCNLSKRLSLHTDSHKCVPAIECSLIFTIYLTNEFGYDDIEAVFDAYVSDRFNHSTHVVPQAGVAYGLWGALTSAVGILMGCVIDSMGVRVSLCFSFTVSTIARFAIALTTNRTILQFCIYLALPIGQSMGIPVLLTAIRRYTTPKNRGFAFGLFYAVMNVAALFTGWIVDALNIGLCCSPLPMSVVSMHCHGIHGHTRHWLAVSALCVGLSDGADMFGRHLSGDRLVLLTG